LFIGPIPPRHSVRNGCGNLRCVRPEHLKLVERIYHAAASGGLEKRRAAKAAQTHCRRGHELTPSNTLHDSWNWKGKRFHGRRCRTCYRVLHAQAKRWRYRRKGAIRAEPPAGGGGA
jgi:hypothetical protein